MVEDTEIERKFLVDTEAVKLLLASYANTEIRQGYLVKTPEVTLRIRTKGNQGELTVKGSGALSHFEKNVEIRLPFAQAMLATCPGHIHKLRYRWGPVVAHTASGGDIAGLVWEIDHFLNVKDPETGGVLWMAEIELTNESDTFESPSWLGREVTYDPRYTNARLSEQVKGA